MHIHAKKEKSYTNKPNKNINTIDSKKLTTDGRITEIRWNNNNYIEFIVDGKIVEVSRRN